MRSLIQTIVVAVSGSDASINAAKYGIIMARLLQLRLVCVYVVDTATLRELLLSKIFVEEESREYEKNLEDSGRSYLNYVQDLAAKKGVEIEKIIRRGAISTEVVQAAEEVGADMILLGGLEEGKGIHDVLSRQRREIVRNTKCSVLIVKEPAIDLMFSRA
jgi:nucleotide-binding universal stress UspA family protein